MTHKDDGGPAFPFAEVSADLYTKRQFLGMSLRDWFAGQALIAIIAANEHHDADGGSLQTYAEDAYRIADAMIAEGKAPCSA